MCFLPGEVLDVERNSLRFPSESIHLSPLGFTEQLIFCIMDLVLGLARTGSAH